MADELQISQRGVEMPASPIRKLAPLAYAAEDRGVKIYRLNIGQPDLPTPQKALDVLKHVDRKTLEYSPSQGYRSLRKALAMTAIRLNWMQMKSLSPAVVVRLYSSHL